MIYGIEDKTLTALGDAVRNKTSKYIGVDIPISEPIFTLTVESPDNADEWHDISIYSGYKVYDVMLDFKEIFGEMYDTVEQLYYTYSYETNSDTFDVSINWRQEPYTSSYINDPRFVARGHNDNLIASGEVYGIKGNHNYCSLRIGTENGNELKPYKCKITINIWGAFEDNTIIEPNVMTLAEMTNKINDLDVIPAEVYKISGNCAYMFYQGQFDWLIEQYGNKIITNNIVDMSHMFEGSFVKEIPFIINATTNNTISVSNMFSNATLLEQPPIINIRPDSLNSLFNNCHRLRIPDNYFDNWTWAEYSSSTGGYINPMSRVFAGCYSIRKYPMEIFQHANPKASYSNTIYNYMAYQCYSLDELIDIPIPYTATYTSNLFNSSFSECDRLMNITFARQEDGTPYIVNWKGQTIDLSTAGSVFGINSLVNPDRCIKYNSGITKDKFVKNDEDYQRLKNDPDWFPGTNEEYSRYNHDSAVNTINSLPDTSAYLATAGGTNTIKFLGVAGSLTDGGAINTLTEEEIAVATAKGWTVSLV